MIASAPISMQERFLTELSTEELRGLPYLFEFWALPHQLPPDGDWKTWVVMGGRGAGKTRAGAEWVRAQVEGATPEAAGQARRLALVGETYDQARDVMVHGESGIMACTPEDRRPRWFADRRKLVWPNGAEAKLFSAHDFEGLRGPQFDAAWVDEIGCAAIDKGSNEPNKFLDPKSSESSLPKYSTGARDDLMQMQYLRAIAEFWGDPDNNPVSTVYGGTMVATGRMFVWAWDARPYPFFPGNAEVWSDGGNYARGHWLNGRVTSRTLAGVIAEICDRAGCGPVDVGDVRGLVRGYVLDGSETARAALQPLLLAFGVDAVERDGALVFRTRDGLITANLDEADLARGEGGELVTRTRAPEAETAGRIRLAYVEADGDYETRGAEGIFPDEVTTAVSRSEIALALTKGEARGVVERWLAEARVARDKAAFALPPSSPLAAGDVVKLEGERFRIDRVEDSGMKLVEAVRVERGVYRIHTTESGIPASRGVKAPLPVWATLFDVPLLSGSELPEAPWIAASGDPWPGAVAVYSSLDGQAWTYETVLRRRAVMGKTTSDLNAAVPGLPQRGIGLDVHIVGGSLGSIDDTSLFSGGNAAAISDGSGSWELLQFREAELTGPDTWRLSHLLRGQQGTDSVMQAVWPAGSTIVLMDAAAVQIPVATALRGVTRYYRVGPASRPVDDASYVELTHAASALGLKPYAPVHLRANRDGAGGYQFNWIRRARLGGDTWELSDVPLGEAVESYRVQVLKDGALRREVFVSTSTWSYDAAMQASDGVTAPFEMEVAQVSDLFGPGSLARIIINA
ncbi:MAG: glycoside hydrolase TIM-barrel-like domain-containing protein [Silicimonas sp.]|nr:glycoside hydrolase TIM-barrel-like domain-containing protein [Silicimonas sp.]